MTVVGSRGMGPLGRTLLGSVSSGLVHHGHGPIAIIHAEESQAPDVASPVLLGIDGSPASEEATSAGIRRGIPAWRGSRSVARME